MGEDVDFCWRMRGLEHISYQTGVFTGCLRLLSLGWSQSEACEKMDRD